VPDLYQPDICVFDLDPSEDQPKALPEAAVVLRNLLREIGLTSWVKTSGSKGLHVVVPLDRECGYGDVAAFAHRVGGVLVSQLQRRECESVAKTN
jgi:bifunctional non-homologous end joining protein LigD